MSWFKTKKEKGEELNNELLYEELYNRKEFNFLSEYISHLLRINATVPRDKQRNISIIPGLKVIQKELEELKKW